MATGSRLAQLELQGPPLNFRRADFARDIAWLKSVENRYENRGLIGSQ